jgi:hypothetical protein
LVHRADADPGNFGDVVRRDGLNSLAFHNPDNCVEHGFDGLPGATLHWLATDRSPCDFAFHERDQDKVNVSNRPDTFNFSGIWLPLEAYERE